MLTRVGDIEVWRILESVSPFLTPGTFFDTDPDAALSETRRLAPRQLCPRTGALLLPIQGFLLKTPDHVILVDACVGNHKTVPFHEPWAGQDGARFMAGLAAAGVTPAEVDVVMCTHLHVDHVGWNTRLENGRWLPTFPNARYLMPRVEAEAQAAKPGPTYNESVLPVIEAGQAEWLEDGHRLGDLVALLPTPGHTEGHHSLRLGHRDRRAIITGDALHSTVQCAHPDWNFVHDADKPRAAASRRHLLDTAADGGDMVIGSHFALPSVGHVTTTGEAFDWREG